MNLRYLSNHLFLLLILGLCFACQPTEKTSILIQNAQIADGTGVPVFTGSVRISGDQIVGVGDLKAMSSDSIIDAQGMLLSPGFIDTHSHHDWDTSRMVEPALSQGITTIVIGQDGHSYPDLQYYFDSLSQNPLSVNVASYVGHNSLRRKVLGANFRRKAAEFEVDSMIALLEHEMQSGALGLSTGLEYDPGIYSDTEEVLRLAKVTARMGGRYISHMRSEDVYLEKSIEEIIRIGKEAALPVQISHFKLARKGLWGKANKILEKLDSARATGIEISADIYPYEAWQSTMTVLFPKRDFDNRASAAFAISELTTPEGMLISNFNAEPSYEGKTLQAIANMRGEDPVDTYMTLIRMSQEVPGESIIAKSMAPEDIISLSNWEYSNICSDGAPIGHPRGWGTFPRYFNLETGISREHKIHKMTAQAAENMAFAKRGKIAKGYFADLILIDPDRFKDRATYEESTLKSEGLIWSMVNGQVVYQNGRPTGTFAGRIIRRGG